MNFLDLSFATAQITEKIINIEIVCIRSSNEISLIKTHISSIYELIIDPAANWPDSSTIVNYGSTGGALHRHRRGRRSRPVQALLSLLLKKHNITAKIMNNEIIFKPF